MQVDDIRAFVPSKNYEESQRFYQALGFSMAPVTDDLSLFENGGCSFFLQRFYCESFAKNLMLQLSVRDIQSVSERLADLGEHPFRYEPIKREPWGK